MYHRLFFLSVTGLLIDRWLKWYVQSLPEGAVFSFLPKLQFGYFLNPSLFFFPAWRFIPWLALIVLVTLLGIWVWNLIGNSDHQAFPTIVLGGLSNVFDRFTYGGVIDYVNIFGVATINLADILIGTGLIILILKPYVKRG